MNAFQIPERSYFAGDPAFYFDAHGKQFKEPVIKEKRPYRVCAPIDVGALKEYRAQCHSLDDCAKHFNADVRHIKKLLAEPVGTRTQKYLLDLEEVRQLCESGLSMAEIAKHYGVHRGVILRKLGVTKVPKRVIELAAESRRKKRKPPMQDRRIMMHDAQWMKFRAIGGAAWLRAHLDSVVG